MDRPPWFLHEMKSGNHQKAKELFEEGDKIMQQNDMIINSDTDFLKDYMNVFRFTQDLPANA